MNWKINNKKFDSGFYTFIKSENKLSDKDLLTRLKIYNYQYLPEEKKKEAFQYDSSKLYITEVDEWTHVMDDWGFSFRKHLWMHKEKVIIRNLAKSFEVFQCSIGDSDGSFDFRYYKEGILQREYIIRNKKLSFTETYIAKNLGNPFVKEEIALKKPGEINKVLSVAELLGIKINHELAKIRSYRLLDINI